MILRTIFFVFLMLAPEFVKYLKQIKTADNKPFEFYMDKIAVLIYNLFCYCKNTV